MNSLSLVHSILTDKVKKGDLVIDATAGRGFDAAFLCELVGEEGKVIAFDVQMEAVDSTEKLLKEKGYRNAEVHLRSHEFMAEYAEEGAVSAVVFNLGYLPKGDHSVFTHAESTEKAILAALRLLKKGGLVCVSVYYGGDSGYEERDALAEWFKTLDDKEYQVIKVEFYNWKKDPPFPYFVIKL